MSALQVLKKELKLLEKTFTKQHDHFRVRVSGVDELTCRFINKDGVQSIVHCNINVSISITKDTFLTCSMNYLLIVLELSQNAALS